MLAVALASGVGAVCRYAVDQAVQRRLGDGFPLGTIVVNVSGSFVLGLVVGSGTETAAVVGAGFAGGFTTLSTWAWETFVLAESGRLRAAAINVVASFGLGLLAGAAGLGLALLL